MKSHKSLIIELLLEKVERLEADAVNLQNVIDEMKQAECDRIEKLKKGHVREPGFYRVRTNKGWVTAEWTGEMFRFAHPSQRGATLEVADA